MDKEYDHVTGDWGKLPEEPCRYCHRQGGIMFMVQDGPEKHLPQIVRCELCKRSWEANSVDA